MIPALATGAIWTLFVAGLAVAVGGVIGAICNSAPCDEQGRAIPSARAASLRPQPPAAFSQSGIDYRGERLS